MKQQPKVVFLDTVHPILIDRLEALGYQCILQTNLNREEALKAVADCVGIVIRSKITIDKSFLDAAKELRFICRSGAGMENIDVAYAEQRGVKCFNSPEGNKDAVAEHAMGMLLMLFNQLKKADAEVRKGIWDREGNRGLELKGKTVGIIGYGNMGAAFAQRLSGFECSVMAYDKYKSAFGTDLVQEVSLKKLQNEADIVSLHLPQTKETIHYVNEDFIQQFQKAFYLINTARGKNVDTKTLIKAIKSGKIKGACLDVLEFESSAFELLASKEDKAAFDYLKTSNKVILSPHVAGWTEESYVKLSTYLADKVEHYFHS